MFRVDSRKGKFENECCRYGMAIQVYLLLMLCCTKILIPTHKSSESVPQYIFQSLKVWERGIRRGSEIRWEPVLSQKLKQLKLLTLIAMVPKTLAFSLSRRYFESLSKKRIFKYWMLF